MDLVRKMKKYKTQQPGEILKKYKDNRNSNLKLNNTLYA